MKKNNLKRIVIYILAGVMIAVMGIMLFQSAVVVFAAGTITLDGAFDDWSGQSCISDPLGDVSDSHFDIVNFCFATNPDVSNAYFMAERPIDGNAKEVTYRLLIDTDNDGSYSGPNDYVIDVSYKPIGNSSTVTVSFPGGSDGGNWGVSKSDGGNLAEWYVPFSSIGITPGQTIRIILQSLDRNTVVDNTSEIQWSPADALGPFILISILVVCSGLLALFSRKTKIDQ